MACPCPSPVNKVWIAPPQFVVVLCVRSKARKVSTRFSCTASSKALPVRCSRQTASSKKSYARIILSNLAGHLANGATELRQLLNSAPTLWCCYDNLSKSRSA